MKNFFLVCAVFLLLLSSTVCFASDHVDVYPAPEGIKASNRFEVSVQQNEISQNSFVYLSTPIGNDEHNADKIRTGVIKDINQNETLQQFYFGGKTPDINAEQSVAWTCFSFSGEVNMLIINIKEPIRNFKILPSSAAIEAVVEGNTLKFKLDEPRKLAVVINGDYLNPLFLFADAPEVGVPDKNGAGTVVIKSGDDYAAIKEKAKKASVLWFEPGIHQIGVAFEVFSNQTIYLAGGAYLIGTLHGMMASNVSIRGRGVLAGDSISREKVYRMKSSPDNSIRVTERMKYHAINMLSEGNKESWNTFADYPGKGCDNLNIEGITIATPRQFFIRAHGVPITIQNVKMVGAWPYNTDGFSGIGQANTTIFDCFINSNDDAIYVSPNYCNIHHCTFWQGNNGCVFQFSWGGAPTHHHGGYIHDCDIIHCGHVSEANNRMVIGSRKSGSGDISDIYFKNIRIEGPVWSLFRLETNGAGELGSISNIRFENITVNGPVINKNRIKSSIGRKENETSTSWIKDISFKNVFINGHPLTKKDIEIGDFQVEGICIE